MIALACLFPIIAVMGYATLAEWLGRRHADKGSKGESR